MSSVTELAHFINRRGTLALCYANTAFNLPIRVVDAEDTSGKVRLCVKYQDEEKRVWVPREMVDIKWPKKHSQYAQIRVRRFA